MKNFSRTIFHRSKTTSSHVWLIFCLLCMLQGSKAQELAQDSFFTAYQRAVDLINTSDARTTDSALYSILGLDQSFNKLQDSLIIDLILRHYEQQSGDLSWEAHLELLRSYIPYLSVLRNPSHVGLARYYGLYTQYFSYAYQLDSVSRYLDLINKHLDHIPWPTEQRLTWWYEKGRLASMQGDYNTGLNYTQRGLDYLHLHFPEKKRQKHMLLNAKGIMYRRLSKTDEAIAHYEAILSKLRPEINRTKMTGPLLNNLGLSYKDCGDWQDAVDKIKEAIQFYQQAFSPTFQDIGTGYDNIAICYESLGLIDSALYYSYKSLDFIKQNLGDTHPDILLPLNSIAYTYLLHGEYEKALDVSDEALDLLKTTGWSAELPKGNFYIADGFDLLAYRIEILRQLYYETKDSSMLNEGLRAGQAFMRMTDYAYDHLQNDISKELFQSKYGTVFSACIDDLYKAYSLKGEVHLLEIAFGYADKFKSLELLYAAQKDKADQVAKYKPLNEEHNRLLDSIRFYEDKVNAAQVDPATPDATKLNVLKTSLDLWKERIQQEHPDYYELIYHPQNIPTSDLRSVLATDQCILSYHVDNNAVFMFVITPHSEHFIKKEASGLLAEISLCRKGIKDAFIAKSSEEEYIRNTKSFVESCQRLYQMLLAPVDTLLSDRVTIIVDKALGYLPFDMLLRDAADKAYHFQDHKYALMNHAISYSYSCRLWWETQAVESRPGYRILAIAPSFDQPHHAQRGPLHFSELPHAETEVQDITSILPGKAIIGRTASKSNFVQLAASFPIIHLATHSKANDQEGDYSFLAFSPETNDDGILYAGDIYNLELNAELITLSACETGLGELRSGEGIISLARAFTFAGTRSILSSLWAVNDKSTTFLMASFYKHLRNGVSKDIALQKAKMDFLRSHGHAENHPFFWAGFICAGDMDPVVPDRALLYRAIISATVIAFIVAFFFFFKKRSKLKAVRK